MSNLIGANRNDLTFAVLGSGVLGFIAITAKTLKRSQWYSHAISNENFTRVIARSKPNFKTSLTRSVQGVQLSCIRKLGGILPLRVALAGGAIYVVGRTSLS